MAGLLTSSTGKVAGGLTNSNGTRSGQADLVTDYRDGEGRWLTACGGTR